ncbi:MAG: long-chain fatty acid--CoA ligase [Firmicutes bacterium]|nr:long-chain fatty acid--CoA ligase [Bacillota bacterium]
MAYRAYLSPDMEAFVGQDYRHSYSDVNCRVNQFAFFLQEKGVKSGDRLAVLCKNSQYLPTVLFAAAKIGVITIPLNWRLSVAELNYILEDSGTTSLVYDVEFSDSVKEVKKTINLDLTVQVDSNSTENEFEMLISGKQKAEPRLETGNDDPAVIMYTSGTTGKPKGAILTHNNFFWASVNHTRTIDWRYKDRFLSVAPLFHIGGLAPIITCVHQGCTLVYMANFHPVEAFRVFVEEKINNLMSVPQMLIAMLQIPEIDKMDLSSLRSIVCGGSPVPPSLINAYNDYGIKVYDVYGITEYSGAVTFWTQDMGLDKTASVGKTVFHGKIKIANPVTGEELPTGQVGEIVCQGPQVFKGYWNNPEETRNAIRNNWYYSGDLGKKDENGFIYVVDRLKDMIISGGENIYPAELENVISKVPGVAEVGVVGIPDKKWGETPKAYVVRQSGSELSNEDIIKACRDKLASYKCVREVEFIEALPRNAVGKVLKTELRKG